MPETTISQRSHLANYFDDQNKSVQRHCHWIVVRWQHLLVAPTIIFWREGLLTQADCSSRDSRLSAALLCSAYCLTILMHWGWWCRQRLYATAGEAEFCPSVHCLSQSTDFLFLFFLRLFYYRKKKRKRKCRCFFQLKNKTPKNKKCFFWRRKIKRKRNFGRPLVRMLFNFLM